MKLITPNRIKNFYLAPTSQRILFLEAFLLLCSARISVVFIPFKNIAKKMGDHMEETPQITNEVNSNTVSEISRAIKKASLYTPSRSMCYEQAITAAKMLKKRNLPSTIYFGVKKNKHDNTKLEAHAWVRSGETILTGKLGHKKYEVVACFGNGNN